MTLFRGGVLTHECHQRERRMHARKQTGLSTDSRWVARGLRMAALRRRQHKWRHVVSVTKKLDGDIVKLYPRGTFSGGNETDELEKMIADVAASGNTRMIVNFKECEWLTSLPLSVFVRAHITYKNRGGEIKICGLGKRVKNIFIITKLISVFDHYETEEEALRAFAAMTA